jgi:glucose/arabinose dehydrogenase
MERQRKDAVAGALAAALVLAGTLSSVACSSGAGATAPREGGVTPNPDAVVAPPGSFCELGTPVAGAPVPEGFCLRKFAQLTEVRTLVLAPGGDLIAAAPSTATPGGASGGPGAIVVLADDDHNGVAEAHTFASGLPDVHGLALGDGYLYFTTQATVWRTPYVPGQRKEMGPRDDMGMPASFGTGGRWTHALARSAGGQLFTSRGEYGTCGNSPGGEISQVAMGAAATVATGFRNPMHIRCHPTDELCAATELGEDLTPGAREKLVVLRPQLDYGYPCCFTKDLPASGATAGACSTTQLEDAEFPLGDTPFGLDWERGIWPQPYSSALFVALHGTYYSSPPWQGARIVFARTDPQTRVPVESWQDFLLGFGPQGTPLERPADILFTEDGRLFFADDQGGAVYWMAPLTLERPPATM